MKRLAPCALRMSSHSGAWSRRGAKQAWLRCDEPQRSQAHKRAMDGDCQLPLPIAESRFWDRSMLVAQKLETTREEIGSDLDRELGGQNSASRAVFEAVRSKRR